MRLILLDIDGVLNSHQSALWFNEILGDNEDSWENYMDGSSDEITGHEKLLCQYACINLRHILKTYPDVRIVVTSTWRRGRTVEKLNKILKYHRVFDEDKIIDKTPCLNTERGYEIKKWIEDNNFTGDFVILDDDSDMGPYLDTPHFQHTDSSVGFDYLAMKKLDQYFGGFNLRFKDLEEGIPYKMYSKCRETSYYKEGGEIIYFQPSGEKRRGVFFYPEHDIFAMAVL